MACGVENLNLEQACERRSIGSCFEMITNILEAEGEFDETLADIPDDLSLTELPADDGLEDIVIVGKGEKKREEHIDKKVPFSAIYEPPLKFKSYKRKVFLEDVEMTVKIISNERSPTTRLLNPNLYTIKFTHGEFTWTTKKRYKHILQLHQQLKLFKTSLNIPFPSKAHKARRLNAEQRVLIKNGKKQTMLPRFPMKPEALVSYDQLDARVKQLEDYLYHLFNIKLYRNHIETVKFLQVSHLSFIRDLGDKGMEGEILKRTGSVQPNQRKCNCCGLFDNLLCIRCNYMWGDICCGGWRRRWFFVKETFCGYIQPKTGQIKAVLLFDQGFEVSSGMFSTGLQNVLFLQTNCRQLILKSWTKRKSKEWIGYLREIANTKAKEFVHLNENSSFAPSRTNIVARWLVDGAEYMEAAADALEAAREEIYIADWWLTPEMYLKRTQDREYWRLDNVLQRKADQGVNVFILLYKEVELALNINSYYTKQKLVALNPDKIKIIRHPDHARAGVYLWAHHEKLIVIDQTIAFLGGIDLCYGRWDTFEHRLIDDTTPKRDSTKSRESVVGVTFLQTDDTEQESTRKSIARSQTAIESLSRTWPGKDYANFIVKDFSDVHAPFTDSIDRQNTPRMPWHDTGVMVTGASARDVARHFIQRWNAAKLEKANYNDACPYLMPRSYANLTFDESDVNAAVATSSVTCQVLRSVSSWSAGFLDYDTVEDSIHEAYVEAIGRAQHFIYIENQFFITLSSCDSIYVKNQIGDALFKRIQRAYREREVFRVYVIMPLLPAFEGELGESSGGSLHTITHWNYASICRGKDSLLQRLKDAGIADPARYITFNSLRNYGSLPNNRLVTELIYVHSKLMIVDDRAVIIGSANINDRSMLGRRDSEMAVLIKDERFDAGTMNGRSYPSGTFAGSLRRRLFREHLGLLDTNGSINHDTDVSDPVCQAFFDVWTRTAATNTQIFEDVFNCVPTDSVKDFDELERHQARECLAEVDRERARELLADVRGHLVTMPLAFLAEENLLPNTVTLESMMPTALWT